MYAQHRSPFRRRRLVYGALLGVLVLALTPRFTQAVDSIQTVDAPDNVGIDTSLALDSNGFPVISYFDATNGALKVTHCNDANCAGGNESIQTVDTGLGSFSLFTSLALDSNGFPVISYYDSNLQNLKVAHCNDANCAGGNESIQAVDTLGTVGVATSLALDSNGFPVVSYFGFSSGDVLKVLHCNDANCAGSNESIQTVDTGVGTSSLSSSLRLDSNGFPVISYYDSIQDDLKLAHCNDANCAGGGESIVTVDSTDNVGAYTSLMLDSSGFPVISYHDFTNSALKLAHCNDANCAGANESIVAVDNAGSVGLFTSLRLDSSGFPVISYRASSSDNALKLAHCNDANCAGGNESIQAVDTVGFAIGEFTSLRLDSNGFPVISYYFGGSGDLKLAHCDDPNCAPANQPPVAKCQNVTVDATATSCTIAASINNGSSDPDSGDTITLSQSPAGPYGLGNTSVTLTVTDSHDATGTCTGTVTVRDTIPPPLSCPGTVTAECSGTGTAVSFTTPQPSPDNCGMAQSTGCAPASGSGFGLGSTTVSCGATDSINTSSCSFSVTVADTLAPSLTCPSNRTAEATGPAGAGVSFPAPAATDACTPPTVSCDQASGATFPLGTTPVNCRASDGSNGSSCSFTVTVRDTTPPSLTCPAAVTVTPGQPVNLGTPTVSDLVDAEPAVTHDAPASYPVGATTVTWTAEDAAENDATCTQIVRVQYAFTGFFPPVDNPPVVNQVKAGQAIPVKFSLGGNYGLNIFAAGSPTSQQVACASGALLDDVEETVTAGGSSLTYDAGADRYHYVWKTQKAWAGQCRQLNVTLSDGTTHPAVFRFK